MSMIPAEHKEHIRQEFNAKIEKPIRLVMFTQEVECQFCAQTRQLVEELAALSDKIKVEIYDFLKNSEKAKEYGVDKVPAIAVIGQKDCGVRFYGIPYGYEFQTLIDAIINVSKGKTDLSEKIKGKIKGINIPVHIQVFVTLTCPYCPMVASIAHKFAIENEMIRADVIDAGEFPHLAYKYGVMGVPKTVINEKIEFVGAVPEGIFLEHVLLAVRSTISKDR